MASFSAVAAVGNSLERLLARAFEDAPPVAGRSTVARLVRTEDFGAATQPTPLVSIFLYRVEVNRTMRAAWSGISSTDGRAHLPLDLHFLMTAWGESPEQEYSLLGRTVQSLEETPILSGPLLATDGWAVHEAIQVVMEDMSTDTAMRIFDSLQSNYKLSVPYIARVVRLDGRTTRIAPPTTTAEVRAKPGATS
jgi:hypothetical protein